MMHVTACTLRPKYIAINGRVSPQGTHGMCYAVVNVRVNILLPSLMVMDHACMLQY